MLCAVCCRLSALLRLQPSAGRQCVQTLVLDLLSCWLLAAGSAARWYAALCVRVPAALQLNSCSPVMPRSSTRACQPTGNVCFPQLQPHHVVAYSPLALTLHSRRPFMSQQRSPFEWLVSANIASTTLIAVVQLHSKTHTCRSLSQLSSSPHCNCAVTGQPSVVHNVHFTP